MLYQDLKINQRPEINLSQINRAVGKSAWILTEEHGQLDTIFVKYYSLFLKYEIEEGLGAVLCQIIFEY